MLDIPSNFNDLFLTFHEQGPAITETWPSPMRFPEYQWLNHLDGKHGLLFVRLCTRMTFSTMWFERSLWTSMVWVSPIKPKLWSTLEVMDLSLSLNGSGQFLTSSSGVLVLRQQSFVFLLRVFIWIHGLHVHLQAFRIKKRRLTESPLINWFSSYWKIYNASMTPQNDSQVNLISCTQSNQHHNNSPGWSKVCILSSFLNPSWRFSFT